MTGAEYIVKTLKKYDVTDAFGIPGAVILELLYTFDQHGIQPHLCYHEQSAGFAACGYAQVKNSLGVAYATKGPGFTNLITAIADAYYDSIPVLFITAHAHNNKNQPVRFMANQEIDTVSMISGITKFAAYVENEEELLYKVEQACAIAMENRKGPVLLDFNSKLLEQPLTPGSFPVLHQGSVSKKNSGYALDIISEYIKTAKRPIVLIGNGIKQSVNLKNLENFCVQKHIPILSSRTALDCYACSDFYFGYIGSRGLRYSNFILGKCDLVIAIGNRMAYNLESKSFQDIMKTKKIIRIDIDASEFTRKIPNSTDITCDLNEILNEIDTSTVDYIAPESWIKTCKKLRQELYEYDINCPVRTLIDILQIVPSNLTLVCDVGNNALWLSRAYSYLKSQNKVLFSMGMACLGNALCKSIGAFYAQKHFAACVIGDQGIQMNIQELEFLSNNEIPVLIILINNHSSGMIQNWERQKHEYDLHTSPESGYGTPDFHKIAQAYDIKYIEYSGSESVRQALSHCSKNQSVLLNVIISPSADVIPSLRKDAPCYQMTPELPPALFDNLLNL